jgi:GxxExxY protein
MTENELSNLIIREAIEIHKSLGPGLLESVYARCLCYRLMNLGLNVKWEHPIPVIYEEVNLECGYRADMIVENKVIIEVKAVDALNDIHKAQVLTYLKLSKIKLGLLINFNVTLLKNGIVRVVNGVEEWR